jgi:hypothetical protein
MKWTFLAAAAVGIMALAATAFPDELVDPASIPESDYVTVKDGQLHVGGNRLRVWAAIGKLYADSGVAAGDSPAVRTEKVARSRQSTDALLDRFEALGFNGFRLWRGFAKPTDYTPGDGSPADDVDYFLTQARKRGMRVWLAGMNGAVGEVSPDDVDVIDDPDTRDAWREAVAAMRPVDAKGKITGNWRLSINIARAWDPRLEALAIQRMQQVTNHVNRHTGLRWADDPVFAVWELSNEEWWMRKMVGGQWQRLHPFFRNQLIAKWNRFLTEKYKDDQQLATAWNGLLPGESLSQGTILLAPMAGRVKAVTGINDSSQHANAALQNLDQEYAREDFARQRGADVLEFFMQLQLSHKLRERDAIKPMGRSTTLSPMVFDTGIGYEIQSQFLHQHADAVAHDAYVNGWGPDAEARMERALAQSADQSEHRRALAVQDAERISANSEGEPWINWLLKPPGISQGVPWLEHNRIKGKPYLVYETQIQQPAKYRADFPLRIAALAAIQDWDWVSWHYFGSNTENKAGQNNRHFERPMDVTTGGHPQGYHYTYDEVQNATMRAAGFAFRNAAFDPAPNPTTFTYGKRSLFDPLSMDYAGSYGMTGMDMLYTTYQYGVRIAIDPTREHDHVDGPVVRFADRHTHNPYTPTSQITFDWRRGSLQMDSPSATFWTGLLARHGDELKFANAPVTVRNVTLNNPPGIFSPVSGDEKYIAFAMQSLDGQSIERAARWSISLVSTSFNSGFSVQGVDLDNKIKSVRGDLPVLVTRVGAEVESPALAGAEYVMLDWSFDPIARGSIGADGRLTIPVDKPVFVIELSRGR